ncbi:MAG: serine/threonine-protein kinase [Myxococcota bacterium]
MPVTSQDLPTTFGPYALTRRLAVGGMAEVYSATLHGAAPFEKPVAVKRIHAHLSSDDDFVSMLIAEAKLCSRLQHKNVVQTLDLGCIDGAYFIVMERIEGLDLGLLLHALRERHELLPWPLASYVVCEICRGLSYAHSHADEHGVPLGIVHRDVSPQNVLVSDGGEVKVADFGIAKSVVRLSDPEAGVIKGKYFYMSPEQGWGDPLDRRTDIFSAGVVLWESLTGRALRQTQTVTDLLNEVREGRVPPASRTRPGLPSELDAIIARATAHDPADRYQDAAEMADALEVLAGTVPDPAERLGTIVRGIESVNAAAPQPLPRTRQRAVVRSAVEQRTPTGATLRYRLEDGEPTVAGLRSPRATALSAGRWVVVALALGLSAAGVWWFGRGM